MDGSSINPARTNAAITSFIVFLETGGLLRHSSKMRFTDKVVHTMLTSASVRGIRVPRVEAVVQ